MFKHLNRKDVQLQSNSDRSFDFYSRHLDGLGRKPHYRGDRRRRRSVHATRSYLSRRTASPRASRRPLQTPSETSPPLRQIYRNPNEVTASKVETSKSEKVKKLRSDTPLFHLSTFTLLIRCSGSAISFRFCRQDTCVPLVQASRLWSKGYWFTSIIWPSGRRTVKAPGS